MAQLWRSDMVEILRWLLFDYTEPYTYSDATLERLLVVAAHFTVREADFGNGYAVDISEMTITPDPAGSSRDLDFMNLTTLKAACVVDRGKTRIAVNDGGFMIKDDWATVDFREQAAKSLSLLKEGYCSVYEQAILEYNINKSSALAEAVLSPFRAESYRGYLSSMVSFDRG